MGIKSLQNKDILAYKNDCYLGMTAEEAKEAGRSVFRDFKKLDTDKDYVISFEEIIEQRDKKAKRKRIFGNIFMGIGAYYCVNGIQLERQTKEMQEIGSELASKMLKTKITPKSTKIMNLWNVLFFVGIGTIKYFKSKNIDKKTQEYTNSYYKQIAS